MTHVIIRDVIVRKEEFMIDMTVFGNIQPNPKDVMDFLTQLFSKLRFDDTKCRDPRLSDLCLFFNDLAREKVFIAKIPENTYILFHNPENAIEEAVRRHEDIVDLFVDTGSPLKHVYIVKVRPGHNGYNIYIIGLGYTHYNIDIFMNLIPRKEDDGEIHVEISQSMRKNRRALLKRALAMPS